MSTATIAVNTPTVFDPILYLAEMRQAGVTVVPTLSMSVDGSPGRRGGFYIAGSRQLPILLAAYVIDEKWASAMERTPGAVHAVYRVLVATGPAISAEPDLVIAAIAAHRAAYDAWNAGKAEATSAPDDPSDLRLAAADDLLDQLAAMVPQSIAGLSAYIEYFAAYAERDEDPATQHPALASIAAASRALLADVASPRLSPSSPTH